MGHPHEDWREVNYEMVLFSAGLDKATKDLQRQEASLRRLQMVLLENCDKSQKKITSVFQDMRKKLVLLKVFLKAVKWEWFL